MKKKCKNGKSCGETCIDRNKICQVELGAKVSSSLSKSKNSLEKGGSVGGGELRGYARGVISSLNDSSQPLKKDGAVREGDIRWEAALDKGVGMVGSGRYASFVTVPESKLVEGSKGVFPDGVGVKIGQIGKNEVEALKVVGSSGIGPTLVGARLSPNEYTDKGQLVRDGLIAMSKVPGDRAADSPSFVNGKRKDDILLEAVAKLHRLGVAHGDIHDGNFFIDSKGVARFVDFGMATVSPKAALAEALMEFTDKTQGGKVFDILKKRGFSSRELDTLSNSFASEVNSGPWNKISDKDARDLIQTYYEGI